MLIVKLMSFKTSVLIWFSRPRGHFLDEMIQEPISSRQVRPVFERLHKGWSVYKQEDIE